MFRPHISTILANSATLLYFFPSVQWKGFLINELKSMGGIQVLLGKLHRTSIDKVNSLFYREVLKSWSQICASPDLENLSAINTTMLWSNADIITKNGKPFMDKLLQGHNINRVGDLFDEDGLPLKHDFFPSQNLWFRYIAVLNGIPKQWRDAIQNSAQTGRTLQKAASSSSATGAGNSTTARQAAGGIMGCDAEENSLNIYLQDRTINIPRSKQRTYYNLFLEGIDFSPSPGSTSLSKELNINVEDWKMARKTIYSSTISTKLRSFQWSCLNKLIYPNFILAKFGIIESGKCSFCDESNQNFYHLFLTCPQVSRLWSEVNNLFRDILGVDSLNDRQKLIGYANTDNKHFQIINFVLIVTKKFIHLSNYNNAPLSLKGLIHLLQNYEHIEHDIAIKKDNLGRHYKKWEYVLPLIQV